MRPRLTAIWRPAGQPVQRCCPQGDDRERKRGRITRLPVWSGRCRFPWAGAVVCAIAIASCGDQVTLPQSDARAASIGHDGHDRLDAHRPAVTGPNSLMSAGRALSHCGLRSIGSRQATSLDRWRASMRRRAGFSPGRTSPPMSRAGPSRYIRPIAAMTSKPVHPSRVGDWRWPCS